MVSIVSSLLYKVLCIAITCTEGLHFSGFHYTCIDTQLYTYTCTTGVIIYTYITILSHFMGRSKAFSRVYTTYYVLGSYTPLFSSSSLRKSLHTTTVKFYYA